MREVIVHIRHDANQRAIRVNISQPKPANDETIVASLRLMEITPDISL